MSRAAPARMTVRRFHRLAAVGQREVGEVLDAVERAGETKTALDGAGAPSSVQRLSRSTARKRDRRLRFVGVGLTIVNAGAVVAMLALPDGMVTTPHASEITVAVVLAGALSTSQILLALVLGKGLREIEDRELISIRLRSRQLKRFAFIEGSALGVLSALVGWVVYLWTSTRVPDGHGQLGAMVGLMLMLQAWVAPWLVVAETARTHPADQLGVDPLKSVVEGLRADLERDRSIATTRLVAARAALRQSERIVAHVANLSDRPARASWSYALDQLAQAIAEAEARNATLDAGPGNDDDTPSGPGGPPDQDDVDLAG